MYEQEIAKLNGALGESGSRDEKLSQESAGWQAQCEQLREYAGTLESEIKNLHELATAREQEYALKPQPESAPVSHNGNNSRILSRDLADQFGNLLTGVLGHASLAGSDSGTAMDDIRAIERTAREAAQLVRKLSALSGSGRHSASTDLKTYLNRYVSKDHVGSFAAGSITLDMPKSSCMVSADGTTLDVLCDAIARFAYSYCDNEKSCWNVLQDEHNALVSVALNSEPRAIPGWTDAAAPLWNQEGYELYFAREAARGLGGDLEITPSGMNGRCC
jgi:hypothetical protein